MENINKESVYKHARNLQWLILLYSIIFLSRFVLSFGFPDFYEQLFSDAVPSLYIMALGLPITAYAIWYVLQVAPMRQLSKTNKVLGLLFLGIIGIWMTFPLIYKIRKQLERKESGFSFGK
jgi:hypothetical protein